MAYNNIDDFLKSIDSFTSFEGGGIHFYEEDYNTFETDVNNIPEGFEVLENLVGDKVLVARRGTVFRKPSPKPVYLNRGGAVNVYDFTMSVDTGVTGRSPRKLLVADMLLCPLFDYTISDVDSKLKSLLEVGAIGFNNNREYYVTTDTVTAVTRTNFNLYNFFKRLYLDGGGINIVSLRLNIPANKTTLQTRIESGYISLYSITPQQRLTTQQINIAPFVDPKAYNRNVVDIPLNITLRIGDIMFIENLAGLDDLGATFTLQATLVYR